MEEIIWLHDKFLKTFDKQYASNFIEKNKSYSIKTNFALGIEVEILFGRNEQKDCNVKPDPQGNAQKQVKMIEKQLGKE